MDLREAFDEGWNGVTVTPTDPNRPCPIHDDGSPFSSKCATCDGIWRELAGMFAEVSALNYQGDDDA